MAHLPFQIGKTTAPRREDGMSASSRKKDGDGRPDGMAHHMDGSAHKQRITLTLEASVLDRFKEAGEDWQARMNEALRRALDEPEDEGTD
jgi:uncharacterized protein (DUF4415 family)